MERVAGIEPASSVWKTEIMNHYTIPAQSYWVHTIIPELWVSFKGSQTVDILVLYMRNILYT